MPRWFTPPGEPTTTTKTVTKTVTTQSQIEIITTAITTTIIQKDNRTDSYETDSTDLPDSRRSSIDMSEERDPFGDIQDAAHVSGDCVRLFETMSKTAAAFFLAAIASRPLTDNENDGNSERWIEEGEGDRTKVLGFFNETMKKDKTIVIVLKDWSGFLSIYKMKHHITFQQLLESYAEDHYDTLRLLINGRRLCNPFIKTPETEKMAPGKAYEIRVLNEQVGGMPSRCRRRMMKGGPIFDRLRDI